jgi:hypothetical protein
MPSLPPFREWARQLYFNRAPPPACLLPSGLDTAAYLHAFRQLGVYRGVLHSNMSREQVGLEVLYRKSLGGQC